MYRFLSVLLAIIAAGFSSPALAGNDVVFGVGWFDISRSDDSSANFSAEWRGNAFFYDLRPVIGGSLNSDGGAYGYVGLDYDWQFVPHFYLIPGLAVGAWRDGSSIDLGGTLEFHESLEVDYKFDNDYRVGAQIAHTSNADIYSTNPGVNTLMAVVGVPF